MKHKLLQFFILSMLCVFTLSSCDGDEVVAPDDPDFGSALVAQLRGDWQCTYVEESVYMNDTGQLLRVTEGENDDVFTMGNRHYQKRSSPYRYFVYGAGRGSNGNPVLYMEEYDSNYYTVEVTTLNSTNMVWKITFQGSGARAIKHMYFKR